MFIVLENCNIIKKKFLNLILIQVKICNIINIIITIIITKIRVKKVTFVICLIKTLKILLTNIILLCIIDVLSLDFCLRAKHFYNQKHVTKSINCILANHNLGINF